MSFCFIVVVWGEAYVNMLLQVALRCFLSPKNIPALSSLGSSKFIFVTTKKDYKKISASKIYQLLVSYIEPVFLELEENEEDTRYIQSTKGFEKATQFACQHKTYAVYLLPDCLISDGTLSRLEKYAREGRDVILLPGPRIEKEKISPFIDSLNADESSALTFEPRKLVSFGLDSFHPEFGNYNYTGEKFTKWPHMVSWNIPNQPGLLIRAFHLHPIMINCSKLNRPIHFKSSDTIDGNFIKSNFLDMNKFLLETDSDHMILYSMTESFERIEEGLLQSQNDKRKAILSISQSPLVNELHKIYFYNAYKLHAEDLNESWDQVEKESLAIVADVLNPVRLIKKRFFLEKGKIVLEILPLSMSKKIKQIYWKLRERISWFKSKLAV